MTTSSCGGGGGGALEAAEAPAAEGDAPVTPGKSAAEEAEAEAEGASAAEAARAEGKDEEEEEAPAPVVEKRERTRNGSRPLPHEERIILRRLLRLAHQPGFAVYLFKPSLHHWSFNPSRVRVQFLLLAVPSNGLHQRHLSPPTSR